VPVESIPGLLQARPLDGQLHLLALDQGESLGRALAALGGVGIARVPVGFERAVDAFLRRPR
jgi:hypothetical protein